MEWMVQDLIRGSVRTEKHWSVCMSARGSADSPTPNLYAQRNQLVVDFDGLNFPRSAISTLCIRIAYTSVMSILRKRSA
jgi:hypothetical protein